MKKFYIEWRERGIAEDLGLTIPEYVRQREAARERLKDHLAWMATPEGIAEIERREKRLEKRETRKKFLSDRWGINIVFSPTKETNQ